MKKGLKVGAASLAALMVFGVAGCGKDDELPKLPTARISECASNDYSKDCSENYVAENLRASQICVCEISDDLTNIIGEPITLFGPSESYDAIALGDQMWNEGPYVLKKDGEYYMTYSANCYHTRDYCICLAKATNPMGPFVKADGPIMVCGNEGDDFSGPGHNAFFVDQDGRLQMTFHIHTYEDAPSPNRKACICDAKIEDGIIKFEL